MPSYLAKARVQFRASANVATDLLVLINETLDAQKQCGGRDGKEVSYMT